MSDLTYVSPQSLKASLYKCGVWHEDSFPRIATAMFQCRPSLALYSATRGHIMNDYAEFMDMACLYADSMNYPWMKTNLKTLVWRDLKSFYDTLAQLVHEGRIRLPFSEYEQSLFGALVTIWIKVGIFPDDDRDATVAAPQGTQREKVKDLIDSL